LPVHWGVGMSAVAEPIGAKAESCLSSLSEPQLGHFSWLQSLERTSNSLDFSQSAHKNSKSGMGKFSKSTTKPQSPRITASFLFFQKPRKTMYLALHLLRLHL